MLIPLIFMSCALPLLEGWTSTVIIRLIAGPAAAYKVVLGVTMTELLQHCQCQGRQGRMFAVCSVRWGEGMTTILTRPCLTTTQCFQNKLAVVSIGTNVFSHTFYYIICWYCWLWNSPTAPIIALNLTLTSNIKNTFGADYMYYCVNWGTAHWI